MRGDRCSAGCWRGGEGVPGAVISDCGGQHPRAGGVEGACEVCRGSHDCAGGQVRLDGLIGQPTHRLLVLKDDSPIPFFNNVTFGPSLLPFPSINVRQRQASLWGCGGVCIGAATGSQRGHGTEGEACECGGRVGPAVACCSEKQH
jgi:hypothetical protein